MRKDEIPAIKEYCRQEKINELEKVKAKINNHSLGKWYVGKMDGQSEEVITIEMVNRIFDKCISDLKGKEELHKYCANVKSCNECQRTNECDDEFRAEVKKYTKYYQGDKK